MPPRQGTYWVVQPGSAVKHIQSYRQQMFPLCAIYEKPNSREVFIGSDPEVDRLPLCRHCEREARRVGLALEEATSEAV